MLETLQHDLETLSSSSKVQSTSIRELFLQLDQVQQQKQLIIYSFISNHDMFLRVRPEVIYQILSYLTFKEYLKFRLVGKRQNFIVRYNTAQKQIDIQKSIEQSQKSIEQEKQKLEEMTKANGNQIEQQKVEAFEPLKILNMRDVMELKCVKLLPQVAVDVFHFLLILLNPQYVETPDLQDDCRQLLYDVTMVQKLAALDVSLISDQQLIKLAQVELLTEARVAAISTAILQFYKFIKKIIDLRSTQYYQAQYKIKSSGLEIENMNVKIKKLDKIKLKRE